LTWYLTIQPLDKNRKKRLAIITTHPIQYYSPVFKLLHERNKIDVKVFYTWGELFAGKFDPGFNKKIEWDLPLLDGYPFEWVKNTAPDPGSSHFRGIRNPELIDQVKGYQPDAILIYGWAYSGHLKALRYFKNKIPVYFRGDSTILNETGELKGLLKTLFLKWVYKHVDRAFYVGTNNKAYFKKYGLTDAQLTFAPHAIDNERFKTDRKKEADELRSSLKIGPEEILILFAGKFEAVKNVELLLTAFINANLPGARLLLVGNGILEEKLKLQAAGSPVADKINFLDFKNQTYMPVLYQAADIFCLPSNSETWGLAINEAMICGNVILTSDKVGAAVDLVKQGENGAIFKAGSLSGLTEALTGLVGPGKKRLVEMGELSQKIIRDWNFEEQAKAIEETIKNE
jgi:glycosyltransferase involved in cell wall biosynthesis